MIAWQFWWQALLVVQDITVQCDNAVVTADKSRSAEMDGDSGTVKLLTFLKIYFSSFYA